MSSALAKGQPANGRKSRARAQALSPRLVHSWYQLVPGWYTPALRCQHSLTASHVTSNSSPHRLSRGSPTLATPVIDKKVNSSNNWSKAQAVIDYSLTFGSHFQQVPKASFF